MDHLPILENAWLEILTDRIGQFGVMLNCPDTSQYSTSIDCSGSYVLPAFVDAHTHVVFAGSREDEFVRKIRGESYESIVANGGGIHNSARKVQELSETDLFTLSLNRVINLARNGTGAIEIKSGYGLTLEAELKMLRVARKIGRESGLVVKTTFLGAHAFPKDLPPASYLRLIVEEMIPAVAAEGLADYCDVFCETGFFNPDQAIQVLETATKFGLKPRVHANQLNNSGGVQVAVQTKAVSADHLEQIGPTEIDLLARSNVIPVALPGAAYFLGLPYAPARKILDANLPLVVASDFNPGSCPSGNMFQMLSLATTGMRMTPNEAINAMTINAAAALEISQEVGTITSGKRANLIITKPIPSPDYLAYAFGTNHVQQVILNGKTVL